MDLEALKLELLRCLERAEEADRDDVRRQWLSAAETWQSAIESRARIQHLTIEWTTLKSVAGSPNHGRSGAPIHRRRDAGKQRLINRSKCAPDQLSISSDATPRKARNSDKNPLGSSLFARIHTWRTC